MQQFRSIHYLRAVAALMVVVFHIFSHASAMAAEYQYVVWMRGGVDLFFVISGFVMVQSTAGRTVTPAAFMQNRVLRIVPLYWLATLIAMTQTPGQWLFKLQSLLFIPALNPGTDMMRPLLSPGWTLNYEMFFYAVFALTLLMKEANRFAIMALTFAGIVLTGQVFSAGGVMAFYTEPMILEFVVGMAIARFGWRLPVWMVPLGLAAMAAFQHSGIDRLFSLGLPAAVILAGALSAEARLPKIAAAELLGSASYSIYLFHLFALGFAFDLWPLLGGNKPLFVAAAFGIMVLTGCAVYWLLERQFIAMGAWIKTRAQTRGLVLTNP